MYEVPAFLWHFEANLLCKKSTNILTLPTSNVFKEHDDEVCCCRYGSLLIHALIIEDFALKRDRGDATSMIYVTLQCHATRLFKILSFLFNS